MKGKGIIYVCYGLFLLMALAIGRAMFFDDDATPIEKAAQSGAVTKKEDTEIAATTYTASADNRFQKAAAERVDRPSIMEFIENLYPHASYSIMNEYGVPLNIRLRPQDFVGRNGMPNSYLIIYRNPLPEGGVLPMPDGSESGAPITHVYCAVLERIEPLPPDAQPEYVPSPDLYALRMDEIPSNELRCGWEGRHVILSRFRN